MIKKIIDRIFKKSPAQKKIAHGKNFHPQKISKKHHKIALSLVSKNAIKVTQVLQEAGHDAYIVGGAVRDLLLGIAPKDFDVATSATPDQVQKLFRRSRIIGRRFQIVHVTFYGKERPEIIEVSTFRSLSQQEEGHVSASGRILRDNVWGTQAEDALRRDFTINSMYYDPQSEIVLDYHGGIQDIERKMIRMIGEPSQRYREDPVRMLRAIRFSAKTLFTIEQKTAQPITVLASLIQDVPEARLFDEILKLLMSGHAWQSLLGLRQLGLSPYVLPLVDKIAADEDRLAFVSQALKNTDARVQAGKSISPGFLFATLLWHEVIECWAKYEAELPTVPALHAAIDEVLSSQRAFMGMQRRHEADMREIWSLQLRLDKRLGRGPYKLIENPKFRAAYDFLLLRSQLGEKPTELAAWWDKFAHSDEIQRQELLKQVKEEQTLSNANPERPKRRRRRNTKKTPVEQKL